MTNELPYHKPYNSEETRFAEVIVPLYLTKTLTWELPPEIAAKAQVGCRVQVQIKKGKHYAGIIRRIYSERPNLPFELKPVLALIDSEPIMHEAQLQLWSWIASYYCCTEGEVMQAALPAHLRLSSESMLQYVEGFVPDPAAMTDKEYLVAEALDIRKQLTIAEVEQLTGTKHIYPLIRSLAEAGAIVISETLEEKYKPKTETYVALASTFQDESQLEQLINNWSKAPKQLDLLLAFLHLTKTDGTVTKHSLLKKANASQAQLQGLVQKNVLLLENRPVDRIPQLAKQINLSFDLNDQQQKAFEAVKDGFTRQQTVLLHGVTGSGKTMVYIRLLEEAIRRGEQALYLVPEIALTSQLVNRLHQHLGGYVGVYHSKFNPQERIELWNKVRTGTLQVIVGARSALFLPFGNLKLIVVDEEHDSSYKQHDPAPRYHARDAAIFFAGVCQAKVLLGSATPSFESYYHAQQDKYGLVKMLQRFGEVSLPDLMVSDIREEQQQWRKSPAWKPGDQPPLMFTPMQQAIEAALKLGKQVIVFQNRRGYNPMQTCQTCGWIPKCRNCDVSLSFHKSTQKLHCHYCGTTYTPVKSCDKCGSHDLRPMHFGTERLEEQLQILFPDARIGRMDTDSVRGKHAHENIIRQFEQQRIQILVGTQMVVKGLDFDDVAVVGIPDGDSILNFSDFRVHERAFQLIEQVAGRSGRKGLKGKVLLQLRQVNHPLLPYLQAHDYEGFYASEIAAREQFHYPPFTRIIVLQTRHSSLDLTWQAMLKLCQWLSSRYESYLTGPAEPGIGRIRNQHIAECMLKLPRNQQFLQEVKTNIQKCVQALQQDDLLKRVRVVIDVDAY